MVALYHALGTSRILEDLMVFRGLVEPREGIGCWLRGLAVPVGMPRGAWRETTGGRASGGRRGRRGQSRFSSGHAVGNNVGRFWYHQFARAGDAAGCAEFRIFRQQVFDAIEDVQGDALCGGRIMFIDVSAQGEKIVNGFRRP